MCFISHSSHLSWFNDSAWWNIQIMKSFMCKCFHFPVISFFPDPNIFLSMVFTLSSVTDHVAHPYKTSTSYIVSTGVSAFPRCIEFVEWQFCVIHWYLRCLSSTCTEIWHYWLMISRLNCSLLGGTGDSQADQQFVFWFERNIWGTSL